jgi:3',5'-cyclic AMP phosphodiesterase CpdA
MRRLIHLSDLHFGALRSETLEPLLALVLELSPSMVAVSGDITQRATRSQFEHARAFLARLACTRQVVVPGNHDVPLWNPWQRFFAARDRFDAYITNDAFPTQSDEELMVIGINTARSFTRKNGRVNAAQLTEVARRFRSAPTRALRVLTCHHPFVVPEGISAKERAGRSDLALAALVEHEVDLLLTGHRHIPWVSPLGTDVPTIHAGTTTSSRTRGVENSFNDIIVEHDKVTIRRFCWRPDCMRFELAPDETREFSRDATGRVQAGSELVSNPLGRKED